MKFYKYTRNAQIALTIFWCFLGIFWLDIFLGQKHRNWIFLGSQLFIVAFQLVSVWNDYWTVEEDGIAQHTLFYRRYYSARGLKYAGTLRESHWWNSALKKSIEIDITKSGYPRFIGVADCEGFLNALRRIAPHAEIIL